MPTTIVSKKGSAGKRTATFTGEVWVQLLHSSDDVNLLSVTFLACARTHWPTHEKGQILQVVQGSNWICDKGEEPRCIKNGDLIRVSAGTTHWHDSDEGSIMTHLAAGLGKLNGLSQLQMRNIRRMLEKRYLNIWLAIRFSSLLPVSQCTAALKNHMCELLSNGLDEMLLRDLKCRARYEPNRSSLCAQAHRPYFSVSHPPKPSKNIINYRSDTPSILTTKRVLRPLQNIRKPSTNCTSFQRYQTFSSKCATT